MRYTVVVEHNCEMWYKEGTTEPHRENGPACTHYYKNGKVEEECYYLDGLLHNKNGPAIVWYYEDGGVMSENFYLHDKHLTKSEWEKQVKQLKQSCSGKVVEIEGKKYKLVEV